MGRGNQLEIGKRDLDYIGYARTQPDLPIEEGTITRSPSCLLYAFVKFVSHVFSNVKSIGCRVHVDTANESFLFSVQLSCRETLVPLHYITSMGPDPETFNNLADYVPCARFITMRAQARLACQSVCVVVFALQFGYVPIMSSRLPDQEQIIYGQVFVSHADRSYHSLKCHLQPLRSMKVQTA
jgi:hypothetical protein